MKGNEGEQSGRLSSGVRKEVMILCNGWRMAQYKPNCIQHSIHYDKKAFEDSLFEL